MTCIPLKNSSTSIVTSNSLISSNYIFMKIAGSNNFGMIGYTYDEQTFKQIPTV
jgi:hypothetical protein